MVFFGNFCVDVSEIEGHLAQFNLAQKKDLSKYGMVYRVLNYDSKYILLLLLVLYFTLPFNFQLFSSFFRELIKAVFQTPVCAYVMLNRCNFVVQFQPLLGSLLGPIVSRQAPATYHGLQMTAHPINLLKNCSPNRIRTHAIPNYEPLSSQITGTCHYTQLYG